MKKWLKRLLVAVLMEPVAVVLAPVLPFFAVLRFGWCGNGAYWGREPRLPAWLEWAETADNSLWGDRGWQIIHAPNRWASVIGMMGWLFRNRLGGLYWNTLSEMVTEPVFCFGNPAINRDTVTCGTLRCTSGDLWEYKRVAKIPGINYTITLHFGWLLHPHMAKAPEWYAGRAKYMAAIKLGSLPKQ